MKTAAIFIGAIAVIAAFWFFAARPSSPAPSTERAEAPPSPKNAAPDFHLKDYQGRTAQLADFAGKPVVINSWATWCPFCRKELSDFAAVGREFAGNVAIIAIDRAESLNAAKEYTDAQGTTGQLVFLLDPADSFYRSIGGFAMPETIFVSADGAIVFHKRGPMDQPEIRDKIRKLVSHNP